MRKVLDSNVGEYVRIICTHICSAKKKKKYGEMERESMIGWFLISRGLDGLLSSILRAADQ